MLLHQQVGSWVNTFFNSWVNKWGDILGGDICGRVKAYVGYFKS